MKVGREKLAKRRRRCSFVSAGCVPTAQLSISQWKSWRDRCNGFFLDGRGSFRGPWDPLKVDEKPQRIPQNPVRSFWMDRNPEESRNSPTEPFEMDKNPGRIPQNPLKILENLQESRNKSLKILQKCFQICKNPSTSHQIPWKSFQICKNPSKSFKKKSFQIKKNPSKSLKILPNQQESQSIPQNPVLKDPWLLSWIERSWLLPHEIPFWGSYQSIIISIDKPRTGKMELLASGSVGRHWSGHWPQFPNDPYRTGPSPLPSSRDDPPETIPLIAAPVAEKSLNDP